MRGSDLHALIIAGVEALPRDHKAHAADGFRRDDDETDEEVRPDGVFTLQQGQLSPGTSAFGGTMTMALRLTVYYPDVPSIAKRIASDGERILVFLRGIGRSLHADCYGCSVVGDYIPEAVAPGQLAASVDFVVGYNLSFT